MGLFKNDRPFGELRVAAVASSCLVSLILCGIPAEGAPLNRSATIQALHARLPLSFEANLGQANSEAKFLSRGVGYGLILTPNAAVLSLSARALRLKLAGARRSPRIVGLEELPGKANYFFGNDPKGWRTNIPTYARIKYRDVYAGIDLVYYGKGRQLEFDFVVAPGADPGVIQLAFEGAERLELSEAGDLVLVLGRDQVRLRKPVVYQNTHGKRRTVEGVYMMVTQSRVAFQIAAYDPAQPLVIDPVLDYSTYLGGRSGDSASALAVDSAGSIYLAGTTSGNPLDFPTVNPLQADAVGQAAFVAKLDPRGATLLYSTYLGGRSRQDGSGSRANAIAVDAEGNAYVAGVTEATDFPTRNPVQRSIGGKNDGFVAKVDSIGSSLLYSTYVGGPKDDRASAIALDATGRAYLTGDTRGSFPAIRALQPTFGGGDPVNGEESDAFVARLDPTGSRLEYSTHFGGNGFEWGTGIAVDAEGNAYVTGFTRSVNFPVQNALQGLLSEGPMFRTSDGGDTWSLLHSGLPSSFVGSLVVDPHNPSTLYASGWSGIYKSVDGGDTWRAINRGLRYLRIAMLAIDPQTSTLYASTIQGGMLEPAPGFYQSTDGGDSWREIVLLDGEYVFGGVTAVATDPSISSIRYAAHTGKGVLKSTDSGASWTVTGLTVGVSGLMIDPVTRSTLYAVRSGGGLLKTTDAGDSWFPLERATTVLAIDPQTPATLYGANFVEGILKSTDGGLSWSTIGAGPNGRMLVIHPSDPSTLYATGSEGLLKSTDGGATWRPIGLRRSITALAIDPTQLNRVFVGTSLSGDAFVAKLHWTGQVLIYSTYLGGGGWDNARAIAVDTKGNAYVTGWTASIDFPAANAVQQFFNPGTPNGYQGSDAFIAKLNAAGSELEYSTYLGGGANDEGQAIAVDDEGNAYVAGSTGSVDFPVASSFQEVLAGGGRIFKSSDSGASWSSLNARLNSEVYQLAVHPASSSTLFAASADGIVKSEDGGVTWKQTSLETARAFAFDLRNRETVYAGGARGVFRSTDGGSSWRAINNGLTGAGVQTLIIDPSNPLILYAGADRGIFKTTDGGGKWETVLSREHSVYALAVAPSAPSRLYAIGFGETIVAAGSSQGCIDVLASTDAGATWTIVNKSVRCLYYFDPRHSEARFSLMVDPETPSILYLTTGEMFFEIGDVAVLTSTNGGASFRRLEVPREPCFISTVIIDPRTPSTLYGGGGSAIALPTESGSKTNYRLTGSGCVAKSTDGGESWKFGQEGLGLYEPDGSGTPALAIDPSNPATVYVSVSLGDDAWVAKLNAAGSALVYSTYLGGARFDSAAAIAVDTSGNAYVAGNTTSADFPTARAFQGYVGGDTRRWGGGDAFVVKIRR